jgi:hypothetical protein
VALDCDEKSWFSAPEQPSALGAGGASFQMSEAYFSRVLLE